MREDDKASPIALSLLKLRALIRLLSTGVPMGGGSHHESVCEFTISLIANPLFDVDREENEMNVNEMNVS